jgi:hypothetical protein
LGPNILLSVTPEVHVLLASTLVRAFGGRKGTRLLRPLLTSAVRSNHLSMASVAGATHGRSPGVSSVAFRAQSPDLRFAPLMDMDFAVRRPLVRCWRLISGFCPSTRTFAPRFLQTPPRGGLRPCASLVLHLHQVAQRTYTSKLLNMPGTRRNRSAVFRGETSVIRRSALHSWRASLDSCCGSQLMCVDMSRLPAPSNAAQFSPYNPRMRCTAPEIPITH